jgi:hypothetical protein
MVFACYVDSLNDWIDSFGEDGKSIRQRFVCGVRRGVRRGCRDLPNLSIPSTKILLSIKTLTLFLIRLIVSNILPSAIVFLVQMIVMYAQ